MPDHDHPDYTATWVAGAFIFVFIILFIMVVGLWGADDDIHERLDALETPVAEEQRP